MQKNIKIVNTIFLICFFGIFSQIQADQKNVNIILLASSDNSYYASTINGIQSVISHPIEIHYLDSESKNDLLNMLSQNDKAQTLVISIGPAAANLAVQNLTHARIFYTLVDNPQHISKILTKHCGVTTTIPLENIARTAKQINPDLYTIYTFYSSENGLNRALEGSAGADQFGLFYFPIKAKNSDEVRSFLEKIKPHNSALHILPDPLYTPEVFNLISSYAREKKILTISEFSSLVKRGTTFGISIKFGRAGVITGLNIKKYLSGADPCPNGKIQRIDQYALYLNREYAKAQGFELPESLIQQSENTKLMNVALDLYHEGNYTLAKRIFTEIISKNPDDRQAVHYNRLCLEKLTGNQQEKLQAQARGLFQKQQYERAMQVYNEILRINPANTAAKEGLTESKDALANQINAQAKSSIHAGKHFAAVRLYQKSLRLQPHNNNASTLLKQLEAQLRNKIPEMTKTGIKHYNNRNYTAAIDIFSNVMLIAPANQEASEYLKLSQNKKNAFDQLIQSKQ